MTIVGPSVSCSSNGRNDPNQLAMTIPEIQAIPTFIKPGLLFLAFADRFRAGVKEDRARVLIVNGETDGAFVAEHVHDADEGAAFEENFRAAQVGRKDGLRNWQTVLNEFDLG